MLTVLCTAHWVARFGVPGTITTGAQGPEGVQVNPPPPIIAARTPSYAEGAMGKPTILENVDFVYVRWGPLGISLPPVYSGRTLSWHGKV